MVTSSGALLTFGDGRDGKLGLGEGNFANKFRPATVPRFNGFAVQDVSHEIALPRIPKFIDALVSIKTIKIIREKQLLRNTFKIAFPP